MQVFIKYQVYNKLQYLKQWGISKRIEHVRREPAKKKKKKIVSPHVCRHLIYYEDSFERQQGKRQLLQNIVYPKMCILFLNFFGTNSRRKEATCTSTLEGIKHLNYKQCNTLCSMITIIHHSNNTYCDG